MHCRPTFGFRAQTNWERERETERERARDRVRERESQYARGRGESQRLEYTETTRRPCAGPPGWRRAPRLPALCRFSVSSGTRPAVYRLLAQVLCGAVLLHLLRQGLRIPRWTVVRQVHVKEVRLGPPSVMPLAHRQCLPLSPATVTGQLCAGSIRLGVPGRTSFTFSTRIKREGSPASEPTATAAPPGWRR